MKIVFMGTPEFAVPALEKLLANGHELLCVYTQPPRPAGRGQKEKLSPVHQKALELNLTVRTPATLRDQQIQAEFRALNADVAVVAAYGLLLPEPILTAFPYGCINIHPSLLPRWRGAAPIQRPLLMGDKETGITLMQMDKGLDTGDMLMVKKLPISLEDTAKTLHDSLATLGAEMLVELLPLLQKNAVTPVKQQEEGVTYAAKLSKEEGRIDWSLPAPVISRMIRAFTPWPGAYFFYHNEMIKIIKADYKDNPSSSLPGIVLDDNLTIACGENTALQPVLLQRAGKNAMEREVFLRGFPILKGEHLG